MAPEELYIFSGSSNEPLARAICNYLGTPLRETKHERFSHGTLRVQLMESVRNKDVYIVQSLTDPVHRHIFQMLMMLDIARHGGADRVTAVIPYYVYGRSDKKDAPRISITGRLLARLIEAGGADRVITMTLHSPQTHGFFDIPLDHLTSMAVLVDYFKRQGDLGDTVVVSPDVGFAKQATKLAYALGLPLAVGSKVRLGDDKVEISTILGSGTVHERAIVVDDEIATGGTMVEIVETMSAMGTREFWLACTHGLFTSNAAERLNPLKGIREIICTDTVYSPDAQGAIDKLCVESVAAVFGEAIRCNHEGRSVGELFTFWESQVPGDFSLG